MRQGVKTDAGKNRIVPIHSRILAIIEKRMQGKNSDNYLFCNSRNKTMHPVNYREIIWKKLKEVWNEISTYSMIYVARIGGFTMPTE